MTYNDMCSGCMTTAEEQITCVNCQFEEVCETCRHECQKCKGYVCKECIYFDYNDDGFCEVCNEIEEEKELK